MFWFQIFVFFNMLLITLLAINVSRIRIRNKVPNGDGGLLPLKKAIRCHMNNIEHALPFGFIVFALVDLTSTAVLATLVIGFTISRVIHAFGMFKLIPLMRMGGAGLTNLFELTGLIFLGLALLS